MKRSLRNRAVAAWLALSATAALAATISGHPDFTGVWVAASGPPSGPATAGPGARSGGAGSLPFTTYGKSRREAYTRLTAGTDESPGNSCVGAGMPASMQGVAGYPMEIFQRPEQINIVLELHSEMRRIYFGSRNAPEEERKPSRSGYSEGRWEGDTLVVSTNHLVDQVDQTTAHSADAVIVERFRLADRDEQGRRVLLVEMTMTDPKFYAQPVVITKRWTEVPNGRLLPYECTAETWYQHLEDMARKAGVALP
jgi:hypothetical protein